MPGGGARWAPPPTGLTALPDPWRTVVGTGLIGGYTTFSTASLETVRLLAACVLAAVAGIAIARP